MFASTALIAALVKSRFPLADKVAVEKVTGQIKALAAESDTASSAGSQTTIVDEDAALQLQSRIKDILTTCLANTDQDQTRLLVANQAVHAIASALSDIIFVYPGSASGDFGKDLAHAPLRNHLGDLVKVVEMETRAGALLAVLGTLAADDKAKSVTVLASSQALLSMIPNIQTLVQQRQPVVFHVAAQAVDADLVAHPSVDAVLATRNTGALFLASSGVQESHDVAIAAHLLARSVKLPVIHYFDGISAAKQVEKANIASLTSLSQSIASIQAYPGGYPEALTATKAALASFDYAPLEYTGAPDAETILVSLGAGVASIKRAVAHAALSTRVGIVSVRALRPWSDADFIASLPSTTQRVVVLEEGDGLFAFNGPLYLDIAAAVRFGTFAQARPRLVTAQAASLNHLQVGHVRLLADKAKTEVFIDLLADEFGQPLEEEGDAFGAVFWDVDHDGSPDTATHVTHLLHAQSPAKDVTTRLIRDAYRLGGSVSSTHVIVGSSHPSAKAQFIGIHNTALIKEYDTLHAAAPKATVLVHGPWKHGDEIEAHLTNEFKLALTQRDIQLHALDAARIAEETGLHRASSHLVWEAAFLLLSQSLAKKAVVDALMSLYHELTTTEDDKRDLRDLINDVVAAVAAGLTHIELLPPWTILEVNDIPLAHVPLDRIISDEPSDETIVSAEESTSEDAGEVASEVGKWHKAAWQIMFKEAYGTKDGVRPDLHETTYLVKLSENKRLTPIDYDRNVFHLEFDTSGSNLKYEIGDALGVHGHNDYIDVQSFLDWYELNADDVVLVRSDDSGKKEARTVFQLFSQTLDLFGRPSKKFYETLATFATDPKEKEQLLYLVSSEGKEEYKKRVDDTVTYEDLLREFTSAKPPLEALAHMITPIKPRHYSIASSQKMHPNSVHLLVVAVDWATAAGKKRYGQCTRYLANLLVGSDVTVSIKPSVMKLPPLDTQPVMMAGLGTGMAPFRAFIQERAMAKAAGKAVGPVVLYFGSRNRSNEYLYGEELEAYHADGVLSHMGLAFSRDQKQKVYIQHKMKEDAEMLHDYLVNQNGHFYLCGPTWPVPDVKDAVVHGLHTYGKMDESTAANLIEEWKEKEKYILEVY